MEITAPLLRQNIEDPTLDLRLQLVTELIDLMKNNWQFKEFLTQLLEEKNRNRECSKQKIDKEYDPVEERREKIEAMRRKYYKDGRRRTTAITEDIKRKWNKGRPQQDRRCKEYND